jgi:hypothetical protein
MDPNLVCQSKCAYEHIMLLLSLHFIPVQQKQAASVKLTSPLLMVPASFRSVFAIRMVPFIGGSLCEAERRALEPVVIAKDGNNYAPLSDAVMYFVCPI